MTKSEISQLLIAAKSLDSFIKGDENQTKGWLAVLDANMPFDFARKILVQHYRVSDQTIKPVIFIRAWQADLDSKNWSKSQGTPRNHVPATPETVSKFAAMARASMAQSRDQNQFALSNTNQNSKEINNG